MIPHMLWWGFVPRTSQRILGFFSWVPVGEMLIWITLWKLLTRAESLPVSAGEWQVKQTFLQQVVSQSFKGSPSEWWCVELHELIASALWGCSLLKILTPYWFPMAFQKGRTLLIHHMRNLRYDIIRVEGNQSPNFKSHCCKMFTCQISFVDSVQMCVISCTADFENVKAWQEWRKGVRWVNFEPECSRLTWKSQHNVAISIQMKFQVLWRSCHMQLNLSR